MKRIILMLALTALLVLALSMSSVSGFAKQAQTGPQGSGCTTTHKGNSTNSQIDSQHRGGPNSQSTVSC